MAKYGKWIGGSLGWVLGGPIGVVVGFVVGSLFDHSDWDINDINENDGYSKPGDFAISLVILAGAVMKADGHRLKSELNFIKEFFRKNYGDEKTRELMIVMRETIDQPYSLRDVCLQIKTNMVHPARLQLMHFLVGLAQSDGMINVYELVVLQQMASYLGINHDDFESIKAMYTRDDQSVYKVLEVSPDASDEEIKKSYRRLAARFHPDKVSHLGEEVVAGAKEKFQQLTNAFETIKKQRNMK